MPIIASLSALLSRLTDARPARPKAAWGTQSHIDLLAENLPRDREGWVTDPNSIRRNGVIIAWTGPLSAGGTEVTVKMDGQRFPVTPDETRKLTELLAARGMRAAGRDGFDMRTHAADVPRGLGSIPVGMLA